MPHSVYKNMFENQNKQKLYYEKTTAKNKEVFKTGDKVLIKILYVKYRKKELL